MPCPSHMYVGDIGFKTKTFFSETSHLPASRVMFTILLTVTQLARRILWNTFDLSVEKLVPVAREHYRCIDLTLF